MTNLKLTDCPPELQKAVKEKLSGYAQDSTAYKILSTAYNESYIYLDKSKSLKTYTSYYRRRKSIYCF